MVAIRFFIAKRDDMIDNTSKETLIDCASQSEVVDTERRMSAVMDVRSLMDLMSNRRYAYVIKRLILDDAEPAKVARELRTNTDNLYNIKKRAVAALTGLALKEMEKYEKACR